MSQFPYYQLIPMISASLLLLSGCGSTETITTHKQETEIEIDGNLSQWPSSNANIYDSDSFSYYLIQDSEYLYIYVRFKSPFYNHAVNNSGFIVYLHQEEKNRKSRGIGYPSGAFNLLREDPGTFRELTRNSDWFGNAQNQRRIESLQDNNFEQVMIVERHENSSDAQYGFVTHSQIEAQGIEIAAATDQRYYGLEYKIPLDGSPPFELEPGSTYWLGFSIEPPEFNYTDTSLQHQHNRQRGQRNYRSPQRSTTGRNMYMRQRMGLYDEWFKIEIRP